MAVAPILAQNKHLTRLSCRSPFLPGSNEAWSCKLLVVTYPVAKPLEIGTPGHKGFFHFLEFLLVRLDQQNKDCLT